MIKAIIIVNNNGEPRVIKFYEPMADAEGQKIIRECFLSVSKRSDGVCNFLEGNDIPYWKEKTGEDVKLVYRHYATLYFIFSTPSILRLNAMADYFINMSSRSNIKRLVLRPSSIFRKVSLYFYTFQAQTLLSIVFICT